MSDGFAEAASSTQVKEGRGRAVQVNGKKIALFRHEGKVFALRDSCPHQGAPLSDGYVEDGCAVCVHHEWKFRLEDGAFDHNELIKLPVFPVEERDGKIYVKSEPIGKPSRS